jgi:hypothetical protein
MSKNPKIKRTWIKEEKRLVYLLYRKGFIKGQWKFRDLYWQEHHWHNRKCYKTKHNLYDGRRYRYPVYMPEVHFCTSDYWGESDEHSIVNAVRQELIWKGMETIAWDEDWGDVGSKSKFSKMTRGQFIKYLMGLPNKVSDKKINKLLKTINLYE